MDGSIAGSVDGCAGVGFNSFNSFIGCSFIHRTLHYSWHSLSPPILSVLLPILSPFHHTDVLVDVSLLTKGSKFAAGGSGQLYHGHFGGTPVALKELYGTLIGCLARGLERALWYVCV